MHLNICGFQPFEPAAAQHTASLPRWMANPTSVPHQTVAAGPIGLTAPNNACMIALVFVDFLYYFLLSCF